MNIVLKLEHLHKPRNGAIIVGNFCNGYSDFVMRGLWRRPVLSYEAGHNLMIV